MFLSKINEELLVMNLDNYHGNKQELMLYYQLEILAAQHISPLYSVFCSQKKEFLKREEKKEKKEVTMEDDHATPQLSHFSALRRSSSAQGPPSLNSLCIEAVAANVAKPGLLTSTLMARLHGELLLEVKNHDLHCLQSP